MNESKFVFFYGGIFSQWYKVKFSDDIHEFNCAEQYMMFKKAELFHDEKMAKRILKAKEPRLQKSLGREIRHFDKTLWRKKCENIVYNGNKLKFTQNKFLYDKLLETKGKILVEASPSDKIWGIGRSLYDPLRLDQKTWNGENLLGFTLTKLRKDLIGE